MSSSMLRRIDNNALANDVRCLPVDAGPNQFEFERVIAGQGLEAPITANQVLASASAIFTFAIREEIGGIKINPCVGVERNKTSSRERVLSDAEIPKVWRALDSVGPVEAMALRTILLCGQRPGEVSSMRSEHIDEDGWWTLPGKPVPELRWPGTKNAQSHRVWLSSPVRGIIEQMEATGFIFAGRGEGPSTTSTSR